METDNVPSRFAEKNGSRVAVVVTRAESVSAASLGQRNRRFGRLSSESNLPLPRVNYTTMIVIQFALAGRDEQTGIGEVEYSRVAVHVTVTGRDLESRRTRCSTSVGASRSDRFSVHYTTRIVIYGPFTRSRMTLTHLIVRNRHRYPLFSFALYSYVRNSA